MFDTQQDSGGILRSEAYLTTQHTPEKPVAREADLQRIGDAVRPLTQNRPPENLLIYGPAGVGKTTCVEHVFNELDTETSVATVYMNCWQYNTRPSFHAQLLIELGYPVPRKGKPVDELLSKLQEWLNKNDGVAVALDEFDQLQDRNEVIYDLQHLSHDTDNNSCLVMVSNKHPTAINLDPRSESRLTCRPYEFRPYNAEQLARILEQRVEQAFRPGTVTDEVITEIAEYVAEGSGDCRKALDLLLQAGRKADQTGVDTVTTDILDDLV